MIPIEVLATFFVACVLLALTPGPSMSLLVATTTSHGFRPAVAALCGVQTGTALLLAIIVAGMASVIAFMNDWFDVVRLAGAGYLIWMGIARLRQLWRTRHDTGDVLGAAPARASSLYMTGLVIAASNPKVLLFLAAFLPQFVSASEPAGPQLVLLAVVMWLTLGIVDFAYTAAVARARTIISRSRLRAVEAMTSSLLVVGGLALALQNRA